MMKADSILHARWRPGILKAMPKLLHDDLHIPKERIKTEEFTGYPDDNELS
jgi:hypothetical protein